MGLFDLFTGSSDRDVGLKVMRGFFNEAVKYPEFKYKKFDDWLNWTKTIDKEYPEFIGNLVKENYRSTTVDDAVQRASDLANKSQGKANLSALTMAAGGKGNKIVWSAAIRETAKGTVSDIAEGGLEIAQAVKTGTFETLMTVKYLRIIALGGLALYLFSLGRGTGRGIGRAAERLGEGAKELSSAAASRIRK